MRILIVILASVIVGFLFMGLMRPDCTDPYNSYHLDCIIEKRIETNNAILIEQREIIRLNQRIIDNMEKKNGR